MANMAEEFGNSDIDRGQGIATDGGQMIDDRPGEPIKSGDNGRVKETHDAGESVTVTRYQGDDPASQPTITLSTEAPAVVSDPFGDGVEIEIDGTTHIVEPWEYDVADLVAGTIRMKDMEPTGPASGRDSATFIDKILNNADKTDFGHQVLGQDAETIFQNTAKLVCDPDEVWVSETEITDGVSTVAKLHQDHGDYQRIVGRVFGPGRPGGPIQEGVEGDVLVFGMVQDEFVGSGQDVEFVPRLKTAYVQRATTEEITGQGKGNRIAQLNTISQKQSSSVKEIAKRFHQKVFENAYDSDQEFWKVHESEPLTPYADVGDPISEAKPGLPNINPFTERGRQKLGYTAQDSVTDIIEQEFGKETFAGVFTDATGSEFTKSQLFAGQYEQYRSHRQEGKGVNQAFVESCGKKLAALGRTEDGLDLDQFESNTISIMKSNGKVGERDYIYTAEIGEGKPVQFHGADEASPSRVAIFVDRDTGQLKQAAKYR